MSGHRRMFPGLQVRVHVVVRPVSRRQSESAGHVRSGTHQVTL